MHTIVYIAGKIGSGKTTLADLIVDILKNRNLNAQKVSYAAELKKQVNDFFYINKEGIIGNFTYKNYNDLYNTIKINADTLLTEYLNKYPQYQEYTTLDTINLEVSKIISYICTYHVLDNIELRKLYARLILQGWGTEVGRAISNGMIWADYLSEYIKSMSKETTFIIDDLRFTSEYSQLNKCNYRNKLIYIKGIKSPDINHTSEIELLVFREHCDTYIWNTYDIKDLTRKAYTFTDNVLCHDCIEV